MRFSFDAEGMGRVLESIIPIFAWGFGAVFLVGWLTVDDWNELDTRFAYEWPLLALFLTICVVRFLRCIKIRRDAARK